MRTITACVCLVFSSFSYSENSLPEELVKELKSIVDMKPGNVIYIDFWASWCNPCRKSFPWMNAMQEKYKAQGFKVLAVNVDKERPLADSFLEKEPANFQIYYDPEGKLAKAFKLKGMPSSFLVNDKAELIVSHKGFFEKKTDIYEAEIKALLQQ